jgi:hypothetical protein
MQPKLISSYDGITSADLKGGSVFAMDNGAIAFVPTPDMLATAFPRNLRTASLILDVALEARGLRWGVFQYGITQRRGYVSRAPRDTENKRVARTPEKIAQLAELFAAFEAGTFEPLLTPAALKMREDAQRNAERKVERDAKAAREPWPTGVLGITVGTENECFVLRSAKDDSLIKAFKASKGRWLPAQRAWLVPKSEEVALGKRLAKVAKARAEQAERPKDPSVCAERERGAAEQRAIEHARITAAWEAERANPLRGDETVKVYAWNGTYTVEFPYGAELVAAIREVRGARFVRESRCWQVPVTEREALERALPRLLELGKEAGVRIRERNAQRTRERAEREAQARHRYRRVFSDRAGSSLPAIGGFYNGARPGEPEEWLMVLDRSAGRYVEDASSIGGDMGREYEFRLTVRAATEPELAQIAERERRVAQARADWTTLTVLMERMKAMPESRRYPDLRWQEGTPGDDKLELAAYERTEGGLRLFDSPASYCRHFLHLADDGKTASIFWRHSYDTVIGTLTTRTLAPSDVDTLLALASKYPEWRLDSGYGSPPLGWPGGSDAQAVEAFRNRALAESGKTGEAVER